MERITKLPPNHIFVFGSNEKGVHGAGSAKDAAKYFGAVWGVGFGLRGQSFAIPTKSTWQSPALPLRIIQQYVNSFLDYAKKNEDLTFHVTAIGCGLAGYSPKDIAPLFKEWPENVVLPKEFEAVLGG